jgi:hypothetical protein
LIGSRRWTLRLAGMATAKARLLQASWAGARSGVNRLGIRYTTRAPTVVPNKAIEIAMKAKWYHMLTLKIRVSRISTMRVDSVTRNKPA